MEICVFIAFDTNRYAVIIQSVLDVKDDTPQPKNAGSIFNRSILILTPARALKFTAFSGERHYLWLTALSFLSRHPSQRLSPLPAIPVPEPKSVKAPAPPSEAPVVEPKIPIPEKEPDRPTRATAMLRRTPLRDSVRIAKDRGGISPHRRPGAPVRNATAPPTLPETKESLEVGRAKQDLPGANGSAFFNQLYADPPAIEYRFADLAKDELLRPGTAGTTGTADSAAEYPTIPRYYGHGRKRSVSVSGPVGPSLKDLQTSSSSGRLGSSRGWSEKIMQRPMSRDSAVGEPARTYAGRNDSTATIAPPPIPTTRPRSRTSDQHPSCGRTELPQSQSQPASGAGSRTGTMRMEAFVEPPPLPQGRGGESVSAPAGKTGFNIETALVPERIRTGRRLPGFTSRRRSKVPESWTRGMVAGTGEEAESALRDPFRGF